MADDNRVNNIMDDSLDILADIKLDGPSESESSGQVKEHGSGDTEHQSTDASESVVLLLIPTPAFHIPSDPPYCDRCISNDRNIYFSLSCKGCTEKLESAGISEILAIMRQWSPAIQTNMLFYIQKV